MLSKNKRNSFLGRNSIGDLRRLSNKPFPYDDFHYQTPKPIDTGKARKPSGLNKSKLKEKMESDRSRDSVEILREMMERKEEGLCSAKFKVSSQPR